MTELVIEIEQDHMTVVPVEAIASWGELLGLSDEEALTAILSGYRPPPLTDHPEDEGWLAPYLALTDAVGTRGAVARATAQRVATSPQALDSHTLSLMGAFGPEVVVAHAEAIQEDVQRTALAFHPLPAEAPVGGMASIVTDLADEIAEHRRTFRASLSPLPEEGPA